jgi:hypothetical protein
MSDGRHGIDQRWRSMRAIMRSNRWIFVVLVTGHFWITSNSCAGELSPANNSLNTAQQTKAKSDTFGPPADAPISSAGDSANAGRPRVSSFDILNPSPLHGVFGDSIVITFSMNVELASGRAAEFGQQYAVSVDNKPPKMIPVSIHENAKSPSLLYIEGSAALVLGPDLVSFPLWSDNHLISLEHISTGARSNFSVLTVDSSPTFRISAIASGALFVLGSMYWLGVYLVRRRDSGLTPSAYAVPASPVQEQTTSEQVARLSIPPPTVPGTLLNAVAEQQAILVLGGRASALCGFPSEAQLAETLVQRLRSELPQGMLNVLDNARSTRGSDFLPDASFSRVMDAIASTIPRERLALEIKDIFSKTSPSPRLFEPLARMPWHGVISLTWDSYAEAAFTRAGSTTDWRKFTLDESADLPSANRGGERLFLRPLGELDRPPSLSLSMEEYRRNLLRWPEFQRQVGLLLQTQTFLFVGVEIAMIEQFLQSVSFDLDTAGLRHFALVPAKIENELLQSTLSRFGVQLLPYADSSDDHEILDFVSLLSRRLKETSSRVGPSRKVGASHFARDRLQGVKLTNIGLFDSLELKFQTEPVDDARSAPWTVIFGPNGCGKSSILRAIGMVLAGSDSADAASRLLQNGKAEGQVEILFGSSAFKIRLVRDRDKILLQTGTATPVEGGLALVLGFPALRGGPSPNPRGVAPLQPQASAPADLLPMVFGDVDKRLGSFKQWLINVLEQAGRKSPRALNMKSLLDDIIKDVVPGEFQRFAPLDSTYVIKVKTDDSTTASPNDIPFDDLSQGMTSIFNWLGVLTQRIYDFYPDDDKPERNYAIALIDEIDAHLHPDWQRRLVELTKKFFPNVQVLATSHSPLLAGALRKQEICVLERDPLTRAVSPLPVTIDPYGMRAQFILMSRIFGLTSDRNPELEGRIARHVELSQKRERTAPEEEEIAELTKELQDFRYAGARPARSAPPAPAADLVDAMRDRFSSRPTDPEAPEPAPGASA